MSFTDSYDRYLKPDKQTLEMMDLNTGKPVSKKKYTTKWDDSKHMFTLTVTDHGLEQAVIDDLIEKAHQVCPYSNATRNNVDVKLSAE